MYQPTEREQQGRQITMLRHRLGRAEGEKAVLPEIDRVELRMALEPYDLLVVHTSSG